MQPFIRKGCFVTRHWVFRDPFTISPDGRWPFHVWFYHNRFPHVLGVGLHYGKIADAHFEIGLNLPTLVHKPYKGSWYYEWQIGPWVIQVKHTEHTGFNARTGWVPCTAPWYKRIHI